jgi:hypothetical protein
MCAANYFKISLEDVSSIEAKVGERLIKAVILR